MFRYAKYLVPYFFQAPRRNPAKVLAGIALAYGLIGVSGLFFVIALFLWLSGQYSTEAAFAVVGIVMMLAAFILLAFVKRSSRHQSQTDQKQTGDPLAQFLPDVIKSNPTTQALLRQVEEAPITATATAVTVGMLLSREILEDQ